MFDTSPEGIRELAQQGESETVEFKATVPTTATIAKVLASFQNSHGGILLIGVADRGGVVGLTEPEAALALHRLKRVIPSVGILPVGIGGVEIDGKCVLYAEVESAPASLGPATLATGEIVRRKGTQDVVEAPEGGPPPIPLPGQPPVSLFVAMSFRTEEEPHLEDYYQAMRRAALTAAGSALVVDRMDGFEGDYEISQEILSRIDDADVVLADFTLNSRNVYLEYGYARGKNKIMVLTAIKDTQLEFDVRNWRTHFYRNATDLEEKLVPAFRNALREVRERHAPPPTLPQPHS